MSLDLDPDALGGLYRERAKSLPVYSPAGVMSLSRRLISSARRSCAHARAWTFRGESWGEAEGWVWGIARHVLADALRRGRAERRALDRLGVEPPRLADDELARVEQLAGLIDLKVALAGTLEQLSPARREALRLRVVLLASWGVRLFAAAG